MAAVVVHYSIQEAPRPPPLLPSALAFVHTSANNKERKNKTIKFKREDILELHLN
jgi:hypothetical protein